jgi:hypothetical protein
MLLAAFRKNDGSDWPLNELLSRVARTLLDTGLSEGPIVARFEKPMDMSVGSVPVLELFVQLTWRLVNREQPLPIIAQYAEVEPAASKTIGQIESNTYSSTAAVQSEESATILVDVSVRSFVPGGILSRIDVDLGRPVKVGEVGLLGLDDVFRFDVAEFELALLNRHSRDYRFLARMATQAGHSVVVPAQYPEGHIQPNV